ncbi:hypothetical protein A2738_03345 [Candidatus Nomurabacteria bacterium RIFCSPHIGHO2_01_FULL_42_15]|uniref:Uncharacterized protein n=1 Tax=Candidatus Nomurabacteria bacterium RIFCSPHIGHO2_01_FULL_42_15 TaxID=1801742 RepID=A0A1F6VDS9_9BACT|nr:MAG: hypothetical protein A2738_03345 [Candidatus Nomurabacteria bacterium RIFCSPHIGHO2_01_FULL_42_15]OGI93233.1 MAG: hypothetical protein A3A99_03180 [Candidatus Nomurabacteria bacterium RIFCSPLOWO2_01_FULL_41_18]
MKIKIFKKEKKFNKESSGLHLDLYWRLVVLFMFAATLSAFFLGYYLFGQTNKEIILPADEGDTQVKTIKKERIEKSLQYFSLRKEKSNQILNSPAPVVDPSL